MADMMYSGTKSPNIDRIPDKNEKPPMMEINLSPCMSTPVQKSGGPIPMIDKQNVREDNATNKSRY